MVLVADSPTASPGKAKPPPPAGSSPISTRVDAIDALANLSSSNPARKRVPQPRLSQGTTNAGPQWDPGNNRLIQEGGSPEGGSPGGGGGTMSSAAAARVPRVSQPLRVEPPPEYNAPARAPRLAKPTSRHSTEQVLSSRLARRPLLGAPTAKVKPDRMKDFSMLATACQRAGRPVRAAHLTFNQGVLFENMGEVNNIN